MTPERFARLKAVLARRQPDLTVLCDGVHKPHNVSAVLRTADAVGIYRMHAAVDDDSFRHYHVMGGGSKRWVRVETYAAPTDALDALRRAGWRLVVADAGDARGGVDYREIDYTERVCVVVGAELRGVSAESRAAADALVRVPMQGMVESLNVSVAAAVILFEAERQRARAGMYATSRLDPGELDTTLFEWAHPKIARRLRQLGQPYPPLNDDGTLAVNPLANVVDQRSV